MANPGRNDPCPCGSGKKYKQCCLQRASPQRAETALTPARISNAMQFAQELHHLSLVAYQRGEIDQAIGYLEKALSVKPDYADAHNNLGNLFQAQGRLDEAVNCYRNALLFKADHADAHNNLGNALQAQGKFDEAVNCYRSALSFKADYADAYNNMGNALRGQGRLDEAISCFHKAISLKPNYANAHYNLGNVFQGQGKLDEAIDCFHQALLFKPDYAQAHYNLGNALQDQARVEEAIVCYQKALVSKPDFAKAHHNKLLAAHYVSLHSPAALFAEHLKFAEQCEASLKAFWRPHPNVRDPGKRLKVGYVSADFRLHSVAYFIEPLLASHDKSRVEVFCYYLHDQHDSFTDRIVSEADHWVQCTGMLDDQIAERIRLDGIDILVDLAGHTGDNRLLVFARKPAPVQVTYLGYPDTTGLSAMDYRFTDMYADPPGTGDEFYTEELVRLPQTFVCYRPAAHTPEVQPIPTLGNGFVTFGSFNILQKITPEVIALWSRILLAVPASRMFMKSKALSQSETRTYVLGLFERHGIPEERLTLLAWDSDPAQHLSRYHEIDICLDSFPYNGTTTTCEALWMGVPVVTLSGERHSGRVGVSLLNAVGLEDWIAGTSEQYVAIAARMAADIPRLAELRASLRGRMAASPLCDGKPFAAKVEAAYREMWREYCASMAME